MLELSGKLSWLEGFENMEPRRLLRVSTNAKLPHILAKDSAFLVTGNMIPAGFMAYIALKANQEALVSAGRDAPKIVLPDSAGFLSDGDIIRIHCESRAYRVLFRQSSRNNSILLTENCDHYCLMCSQPPRDVNDSWILHDAMRLIRMLPMTTRSLGFTGGEPTLYGDRLVELLELAKNLLPYTSIHVLSNGRRFAEWGFASRYAAVSHPDLMVGIPLYSDDPVRHNYVVQSNNAFEETIRGILNLKRLGQRVELRVVLHRQTVGRLPQLARFISRNLLFVDQVALMGLEITGFTRGNLDKLWIDPLDYKDDLEEAVAWLSAYRIPTLVYNHQLCVVAARVRPFCVKSISDWKNEYLPICGACGMRHECGGFFSSAIKYRHSDNIAPILHAG